MRAPTAPHACADAAPLVGARSRARPSVRAFTVIELLVTLAIIAILMGISLGVLSRFTKKDALEATTNGVRALLRRARNAAQEERIATVVEVDGKQSVLRAQTRTVITLFRFENPPPPPPPPEPPPGTTTAAPPATEPPPSTEPEGPPPPFEVAGAVGYSMTVEGAAFDPGYRGGEGLAFGGGGAWAWIEDRPALSPAEGVSIELALLLGDLSETLRARATTNDDSRDQAAAALRAARAGAPPRAASPRVADWQRRTPDAPPLYHVARKGKAWSIGVTADYALEVALSGPHPQGGADVTWIARTAPDTLRPARWYRVGLVFDGTRSRVVVDGIPRVHQPLPGNDVLPGRLLRDPAPLSLSDPDPAADFYGVIDELKVAAVLDAQRLEVPADVLVVSPEDAIGFDLLGQLDTARHAEPVVIYLTDDEKAWALLAPPAAAQGTQTRAEAERRRLEAGAKAYDRFVKGLDTLDPNRWRAVVIERTGMVR